MHNKCDKIMKQMFIYYAFICIFYSTLALGEDDTVSYYISKGNDEMQIGNYSAAVKWYDKAIEAGYQPNAPLFSEIGFEAPSNCMMWGTVDTFFSGYTEAEKIRIDFAQPIGQASCDSDRGIIIFFTITNPNQMQMKINELFVDVGDYSPISNPKVIPLNESGNTRNYYCNILPKRGLYKCIKCDDGYDYIKLSTNELENFGILVNTLTPGAYELGVHLNYSIGGESKSIEVRDSGISDYGERGIPVGAGFFDPTNTE